MALPNTHTVAQQYRFFTSTKVQGCLFKFGRSGRMQQCAVLVGQQQKITLAAINPKPVVCCLDNRCAAEITTPAAKGACVSLEHRFIRFYPVLRPPRIGKAADNGFWVNSGEHYFLLLADKYGAVLHATTAPEFEQAALHVVATNLGATDLGATEKPVLLGNRLRIGQSDVILDLPATGIGVASNAHSFALTSPYSHSIQIWSRS